MIRSDSQKPARGGNVGRNGRGSDARGVGAFERGERIGRFRIIRLIGVGGMGVVYKAMDEALGRHVALKHPRADVPEPQSVRARFLREARSASCIQHPGVVPIFEVFEHGDLPVLVMELIEGPSLKDRITEVGPLPIEEITRHGAQLAEALAEAHRINILHRDLKPANVLLDRNDRARLVDFGLVRQLSSDQGIADETLTRLTGRGLMVGTPGYMSPEQALGRPLDARSDIFGLGLVLYEMTTGVPGHGDSAKDSWLDGLLHGAPQPILNFRGDVPEVLADIIRKTLARDPEKRFQTAEALAEALQELHRDTEAGVARARFIRSRRRRRWAVGLSLAALVAAMSVGVWKFAELLAREDLSTPWVATPLTNDPAWAADPALSPDETMIAYVSGRSGAGDIWLMDTEGGNAIQLTDHPAADRRPAWSPDGSEIYFTSYRSGEAAIWKVPRLGGPAELVLADADDPDLSPDGTQLAFTRRGDDGNHRVFIAPIDDVNRVQQLTSSEAGRWLHREPKFSPDGTKILYRASYRLRCIDLSNGRDRVVEGFEGVFSANWLDNTVVFSRSPWTFRGNSIWRSDLNGRTPQRLTAGTGSETQVYPSGDGDTLIVSSLSTQTEIWITDFLTGRQVRVEDVAGPDMPVMAPDGKALAFIAGYRGESRLFLQTLQEGSLVGNPRVIGKSGGLYATPVFSPDGSWLVFQLKQNGSIDIWALSLEDGKMVQFTTDEVADDGNPFFTPDGRHLVFASDRNGQFQIWWAGFSDGRMVGEPERLTFGETTDYLPKVSPDGSMVTWQGTRGTEENLWIRSLSPGSKPRPLTRGRWVGFSWWEPNSQSLLASGDWDGPGFTLRRVYVDGRPPEMPEAPIEFGDAFSMVGVNQSACISLSADGRFAAHTKTVQKGNLWILKRERQY